MIPRKSKFGVNFHIRVYTFSNIDEKQECEIDRRIIEHTSWHRPELLQSVLVPTCTTSTGYKYSVHSHEREGEERTRWSIYSIELKVIVIRDKRTMYRIKEDPVHSISPSFPLRFETFERFPKNFYISTKFDKLELNFFPIFANSPTISFSFFYLIFKWWMINGYIKFVEYLLYEEKESLFKASMFQLQHLAVQIIGVHMNIM